MSSKHFTSVFQVTGCKPRPSSHLCRMARHALSTWKCSLSLTAQMTRLLKWRARASSSQSAEISSITLTTFPLTPTNFCSCHNSGLSPARGNTILWLPWQHHTHTVHYYTTCSLHRNCTTDNPGLSLVVTLLCVHPTCTLTSLDLLTYPGRCRSWSCGSSGGQRW